MQSRKGQESCFTYQSDEFLDLGCYRAAQTAMALEHREGAEQMREPPEICALIQL